MTRWAVWTQSGKNLRVYAKNLAVLIGVLGAAGEKSVVVLEAGQWKAGRLVRPAWDSTSLQEGRRAPGA